MTLRRPTPEEIQTFGDGYRSEKSRNQTVELGHHDDAPTNAVNYGIQKETTRREIIVAYCTCPELDDKRRLRCLVDARFYMGRSSNASNVLCSVWIHHSGRYQTGFGKAGGWGYHKESAAFDSAIRNAGITMTQSVHGVGDTGIDATMHAIVDALVRSGEIGEHDPELERATY